MPSDNAQQFAEVGLPFLDTLYKPFRTQNRLTVVQLTALTISRIENRNNRTQMRRAGNSSDGINLNL